MPHLDNEGYYLGEVAGEARGMKYAITDILEEKFGKIPPRWEQPISAIKDPVQLRSPCREIYSAQSTDEADTLLKKLA